MQPAVAWVGGSLGMKWADANGKDDSMKTTVKLEAFKALVIEPAKDGVRMSIQVGGVIVGGFVLTADQIGAAMFGVEVAAEAAGIAAQRASS